MANIKKSFNFRNGVQVDDDNLKVSATGLVGIGTTVPTEALDVRGNLVVSGVSSAATIQAGVLTVTTFNPTSIIGAGISVVSGVVTASSGIVTYYGDARFLQGLPTSQWEDVNTGFGVSSIYNTGGNVGIATSNPQFTLQVGGDVNSNKDGVGISSAGNIKISGIASASQFSGNLTGNISSDTVVSGIATFSKDIDVDGHTNLDNVSIAGVSTFTGDAILNGDVRVGTAMTFSSNGIVVGNNKDLKIGSGLTIASNTDGSHVTFFNNTEVQHILEPNVTSEVWTSEIQVGGTTVFVPQFKIHRNTGVELYYEGGGIKFATSGMGATVYGQLDITNIVASGIITATTELNSPLIGVGTDVPANDIQVRKSGDAEIQITSDSGIAGLTVGREASTGNVNNAEFRYGGGAGAPYSTPQSLDLVNYGTHNFNYYLSASNPSAVVGDFHWHKGLNNTKLMTLTNSGRLGIGETQPDTALHVAGVCTVTSNSFVAANLEVGGNTTIGGNLDVSGSLTGITNFSGDVTGNITGNLDGNVNSIGISTFSGQIGIGTDNPIPGIELDAHQVRGTFFAVGVGTTSPNSGVDFSDAGSATDRFLIPPKVTTTERNNLEDLVTGALVFNTTSSRLELYLGSSWVGIATVV